MSTAAAVLVTALLLNPAPVVPPTYVLGGTGLPGTHLGDRNIRGLVGGYLAGGSELDYPHSFTGMDASIKTGAANILDTLDTAEGPIRIAGVSQGAMAIAAAKRDIMALDEADRPAKDQVVFVAIADPTGATGIGSRFPGLHIPIAGVTFLPAPETPYDTIVITREYDGLADFPDRPENIIALLNAAAGFIYVHPVYDSSIILDELPQENVTETVNGLGGRTTTYLFPTEHLPLVQPLRELRVDERFVAAIEAPLRQLVDAGYSRNDQPDFRDRDRDLDLDRDEDAALKQDRRRSKAEAAAANTSAKTAEHTSRRKAKEDADSAQTARRSKHNDDDAKAEPAA